MKKKKKRIKKGDHPRPSMKDKKKSVLERAKGLTVGLMYVCLFTKMPWKLSFDNLKTPKMCFQFL